MAETDTDQRIIAYADRLAVEELQSLVMAATAPNADLPSYQSQLGTTQLVASDLNTLRRAMHHKCSNPEAVDILLDEVGDVLVTAFKGLLEIHLEIGASLERHRRARMEVD